MDNILLSHLLDLLDLVQSTAEKAYWAHDKHCGADFKPEGHCIDCQHYDACRNQHVYKNIKHLINRLRGG